MYAKATTSFLLTFVMTVTYAGLVTSNEIEAGIQKCQGTPNSLDCANAVEHKLLKAKPQGISRSLKKLTFKTDTKDVSLEDKVTGYASDSVYYKFVGTIPQMHSHVVFVQYYEGGSYILIDQTNGNKIPVSNYPEVSSDGKHFISHEDSYTSQDGLPSLGVWEINARNIKKVAQFPKLHWTISKINWLSSEAVEVNRTCPYGNPGCKPAQINMANNTWKLSDQ